jgi:DNA topoisomerase-1
LSYEKTARLPIGRTDAIAIVSGSRWNEYAGDHFGMSPAETIARSSGLRYVRDDVPGITRVWRGGDPAYFDAAGKLVADSAEIARLNALAIPPAYTDVWICPDPRGHLQATGRDARGRKQYRYHPRWRGVRDETKFERMMAFGRALPRIRRAIDRDLDLPGMPHRKVVATVVRLLETTLMRIGNEEYARTNRSFGLTTLRARHVSVSGSELRFTFRGKGGVLHRLRINDRRIARVVRRCMEIPGQELFRYLDHEGLPQTVDSADVNAYLQAAAGIECSAKDYRTWAGSVAALAELRALTVAGEAEAKRAVVAAVRAVAARLGNTPTVCRKFYIHPELIEQFHRGALAELPASCSRRALTADEARFMAFVESLDRRVRRRAA